MKCRGQEAKRCALTVSSVRVWRRIFNGAIVYQAHFCTTSGDFPIRRRFSVRTSHWFALLWRLYTVAGETFGFKLSTADSFSESCQNKNSSDSKLWKTNLKLICAFGNIWCVLCENFLVGFVLNAKGFELQILNSPNFPSFPNWKFQLKR